MDLFCGINGANKFNDGLKYCIFFNVSLCFVESWDNEDTSQSRGTKFASGSCF